MAKTTFTVDTQLFRELGELLVGRDSTALTELVKNAYDADATVVRVSGQRLGDGDEGRITVVDDGSGMTADQFRTGYLTIAGRGKDSGDRRSPVFGRRFTGEKGIGRLATHKLAHRLDVQSVAAVRTARRGRSQVRARIDWDAIERYSTLADIGSDALKVRKSTLERPKPTGTAIVLGGLRHAWTEDDLSRFLVELGAFEPPRLLIKGPSKEVMAGPLTLRELPFRDAASSEGFTLELEGDFERSEDLWEKVADMANWAVELESSPARVRVGITPTRRTTERIEDAEPATFEFAPPAGSAQPSFTARILAREGASGTRRAGDFASLAAGVRVYMEGFRVAPYGDNRNDWLDIDRDYARRSPRLNLDLPGLPAAPPGREGLRGLPNNAYVGAVLLTHAGAPDLEMLVNREGFVPSPMFEAVRHTVRVAVDLLTRVRARHGAAEGSAARGDGPVATLLSPEMRLREGIAAATTQARALRTVVADLGAGALDDDVGRLIDELGELDQLAELAVRDRSLLRILASVGTQMAAFVHETRGLAGMAHSVTQSLERLADAHPDDRATLLELASSAGNVAKRIEGQARYLDDATALKTRRRRQRLKVAERFDAAADLVQPVAERLGIDVDNEIPADLRTAPMFPAELTMVFSNLLTNAVKAAGEKGRIRVSAARGSGGLKLRVENTGAAVDPVDGERWFAPFASTTAKSIDPVLGQGMGLGLPITRSIVEDYRGGVRFVAPRKGFRTAVEVRLP
jgi:signal transduction histidine kinase